MRSCAAPTTCAALVACAALAACGTQKTDSSPEGVVKQLWVANAKRDTEAIYKLLGPKTRARLTAAAARANKATEGKHKFKPHEMLSAFFRPSGTKDWEPQSLKKGFRLIEKSSTTARVEVRGKKKSQRAVVTLVKVDGEWRVEFERPTRDPDAKAAPKPTAASAAPAAPPAPTAAPAPSPKAAPKAAPGAANEAPKKAAAR